MEGGPLEAARKQQAPQWSLARFIIASPPRQWDAIRPAQTGGGQPQREMRRQAGRSAIWPLLALSWARMSAGGGSAGAAAPTRKHTSFDEAHSAPEPLEGTHEGPLESTDSEAQRRRRRRLQRHGRLQPERPIVVSAVC